MSAGSLLLVGVGGAGIALFVAGVGAIVAGRRRTTGPEAVKA